MLEAIYNPQRPPQAYGTHPERAHKAVFFPARCTAALLLFIPLMLLCSRNACAFNFRASRRGLDLPDLPEAAVQTDLANAGHADIPGSPAEPTAGPAASGDSSGARASSDTVPSLSEYARDLPSDLWHGTMRVFSEDNTALALTGLAATGVAFTLDHSVKHYFQTSHPLSHVSKYGNLFGDGIVEAGVGAALLGTGELAGSRQLADTGAVTLEAIAVSGLFSESIKFAAQRKRPDGSNDMSFPSGHTTVTATMAASLSEMSGWDPRVSVPLYLLTAFVGASRIECNRHYASDVVAGAMLGTIVGSSVAKYRKESGSRAGLLRNMTFSPVFGSDYTGLLVSYLF